MDSYILLAKLLISYLIGAVPFAVVAMWGTGIDIRKVGSRNPGFNNVLRVGTKWRAAIALAGDVSKGFVTLMLLSRPGDTPLMLWSIGLAAILGHCWSPFLGFSGGKGVATTVGVFLFLEWRITAVCLVLYPLLRIFGRRMGWSQEGAISSLVTMCVIAAAVLGLKGVESGIFAFIALFLVLLRHSPNLRDVFSASPRLRG